MQPEILVPILLLVAVLSGLAAVLLLVGNLFNPGRVTAVKQMPYESGMDPVHDTRRRFDVRFHLLAIAFLIFDVELLFLYPWAVALRRPDAAAVPATAALPGQAPAETTNQTAPAPTGAAAPHAGSAARPIFVGGIAFVALLTLGLAYDWRKGILHWR